MTIEELMLLFMVAAMVILFVGSGGYFWKRRVDRLDWEESRRHDEENEDRRFHPRFERRKTRRFEVKKYMRVLSMGLCITGFGAVAAPAVAQQAPEVRKVAAPERAIDTKQAADYSQRQAAAPGLAFFEGGFIETIAIVLIVLLLLILI